MNYFTDSPVLLVSYIGALIWILALCVRIRSMRKVHEREREQRLQREEASKIRACRNAKLDVLADMCIAGVLTEAGWCALTAAVLADPQARLDVQLVAKYRKLPDKAAKHTRPAPPEPPAPRLQGGDAFMSRRAHQGGGHSAPSDQYDVPVYTCGELVSSYGASSDFSTGD